MDLIPKQNKPSGFGSGIKSHGISIGGSGGKLGFLLERWVMIPIIILLFSLAVFGALKFYTHYLNKDLLALGEELKKTEEGRDPELVKRVNQIQKIAGVIEDLKKNHIYSSQFFEALEKNTLPEVQWSSIDLGAADATANLQGQAASYSFLANQIEKFKQVNFEVSISNINLTRNGVEFSAGIKFDGKILLK